MPTRPSSPPAGAETELLGLLAHAELTAFLHTARAADQAPDPAAQVPLGRQAVRDFGHHERIAARLEELGQRPEQAMAPYGQVVRAFHERTQPADWLEGLVKAYVGDGLARDFYREVAARLEPAGADLIQEVLADHDDDLLARTVRQALAEDPSARGRLALWARRIVGETLAQAQAVAVERDALALLVLGGAETGSGEAAGDEDGDGGLAGLGRLVARLTEAHEERMAALGLTGRAASPPAGPTEPDTEEP
ncbi:ferritin-like fold-containing protein [Ornithinicoccus halotolerans]|uniref:ferritin-like fold-containing protein n=1 Tax=Ornithinicoccus halotolerans TaxID=1748220 RepID=UPI00129714EA|nr:ferritin-like fold-containing protein [Ornithinicoccus halotolerans]